MARLKPLTAVLLLAMVRLGFGHGLPVQITGSAGKLYTDRLVYDSGEFLNLGGLILTTDQPGYGIAQPTDGVASGTVIGFDVVDRLLYWDQSAIVPTDRSLIISNAQGADVIVDDDTTFEHGPTIALYNLMIGWHKHLDYTLDMVSAPPGAYGVVLQVTGTGYEKSEPILLAMNKGLSPAMFALGVEALSDTQFHGPGDANGDGCVSGADYTLWTDHFGGPGTFSEGDFNRDGQVSGADFTLWADHFGDGCAPAAAVPEPPSALMGLLASVGFVHAVRQSRITKRKLLDAPPERG